MYKWQDIEFEINTEFQSRFHAYTVENDSDEAS